MNQTGDSHDETCSRFAEIEPADHREVVGPHNWCAQLLFGNMHANAEPDSIANPDTEVILAIAIVTVFACTRSGGHDS